MTPRIKRGTVREDGKVFYGYNRDCTNGEYWVSAEQFQQDVEKRKVRRRERASKAIPGRVRGDIREDGMVFWAYNGGCLNSEYWVTPQKFEELHRRTLEHNRKTRAARYKKDPLYRIVCAIRGSAARAAKRAGAKKPKKSMDLLGTNFATFKEHIEKQFEDGMTWDNYGEWHLDHIIPLASAESHDAVWELAHYTNLQPLWARDNRRKGSKMPDELLGN